MPCIDLPPQIHNVGCSGCGGLQNGRSKRSKRGIAGEHVANRLVEICKECVEVRQRGPAVDAILLVVDFDLARVARRAGHSDDLEAARTGGVKADGKVGRVPGV